MKILFDLSSIKYEIICCPPCSRRILTELPSINPSIFKPIISIISLSFVSFLITRSLLLMTIIKTRIFLSKNPVFLPILHIAKKKIFPSTNPMKTLFGISSLKIRDQPCHIPYTSLLPLTFLSHEPPSHCLFYQ